MQFLKLIKIDKSNTGNITTKDNEQNTVCNGSYMKSGLNGVLKSGYYEPPLGYNKKIGL